MKGPPNAHIELKTGSCQSTPRWDLETIRQRKDATSFQGRGNKGWWIRTDSDSSAATLKDRWPQPSKSSKKMIYNLEFYMLPNPNVSRQIKHVSDIQVLENSYLEPLPQEVSRTQVRRWNKKKKEDPEFTQEGGVPEIRGKRGLKRRALSQVQAAAFSEALGDTAEIMRISEYSQWPWEQIQTANINMSKGKSLALPWFGVGAFSAEGLASVAAQGTKVLQAT